MQGLKPIVILGAGCAGLAAGLRLTGLGCPVILLEKEDHVGGLAGGVRINGNVYEYGPHTFHTTDPDILRDIVELMGNDLIEYHRTIKIKFLNTYFKFPLSINDVLIKLPLRTVVHAGFSFLWHFSKRFVWCPPIETSETVLQRYYGKVLYEIFFKSYITRVWGLAPSGFSPAFAKERIPRADLFGLWKRLRSLWRKEEPRMTKTDAYIEMVEGKLYTTRQGFSQITQRMAEKITAQGGEIFLGSTIVSISAQGNEVKGVKFIQDGGEHYLDCRGIISTLPINEAVLMVEPRPFGDVVSAAKSLQFRALVFVGLLVRREHVLPSSFMYFRQYSFNRISDLSQFGFQVTPAGHTLLVAEISCSRDDLVWSDEAFAKQSVISDLVSEGLIRGEEITEAHVFRAAHAYPIYALNYEKSLETLLNFFMNMCNAETAGRQGRFQYVNTHIAIKMGYEAADRLVKKVVGKDA